MRRFRFLLPLLLPVALLLPMLGTAAPKALEAPWREGGWVGAFAVPRPTLPGKTAYLEAAGAIPTDIRLRIYRVDDPGGFLQKTLAKGGGDPSVEGGRAGRDPLDVLREAFLWGGRRAFVTAHRTASRELRDVAKQTERLHQPKLWATDPRQGHALPLQGQAGLTFISELTPKVTEEITGSKKNKTSADEEDAANSSEDESGNNGHLSRVELPAQAAGVYLIEVLKGAEAAYIPWLVTDLALLGDEDGGNLRVQAVSAVDGAPRQGVTGQFFESGKAKLLDFGSGATAQTAATPNLRRIVLAKSGNSFAILAIEGQSGAQVRQRLYAYTERPLYRPGQEVFVKAILRTVEDGENKVVKGVPELPYTVLDPEDTKVAEGKAKLLNAETATYGVTVALPGAGRLGLYRVVFQGPQGPGQAEFKVEQFVKPAFAVTVSTPKSKVGIGDGMDFSISAKYFYGAAVRSGKAEWFLYRVAPKRNSYDNYYWGDDDEGPAPELVESGELELGTDGEGQTETFAAKEEGLWRLVVKVTDSSGQRNSGSAQVRAAAGDMVLLVGTDRNVAAPGKPFQATARVLDLDGHELSKVPTFLKATRIVADKRNSNWWSKPTALNPGETISSASGPKANLTINEGGLFLVVAEARDSKGRPVTAQRLITVAAEGTPLPSVPDLRASSDKREYRVGDTARILVRLPQPRLTLHWTIENEHLGQRQSRLIQGTTTVVEIPVTASMQPNVWAVFEIVSNGRRQMAEVPVRVPKVDKRLSVNVITDQERYQPGQKMRVNVEVKDDQGRPVAADLSVGVVDEAIYALSAELHPDPVRFFHPTRRHGVLRSGSTEWSFYDVLHHQRPVWSLKQTRRGEFKSDEDKVRQNFKDTAHWVPFLAAGGDGKASTELTLPDNLTAWRATATAITGDTKVGVGRASKPASKPLQVSLTLPRTLSVGEEARAIAQVRNLTGQPLSGTLQLEVANGKLNGNPQASFSLQDQGEYTFTIPLLADKTGALTVTARVQGGGRKDAERRSVNVLDQTVPASISGSVHLSGGSQTITIPAPLGAKGEATLSMVPVGALEHLMAPSLPYLVGYPYGCVEQTLSSFVPNVLVADLVKRGLMPSLDWKQLVDLDRNIRDGVFRVYGYQQPNGGWGWYAPHDFGLDANPHTTGYAIWSFAAMKRMGYGVDENVYRRGRQAAMNLFRDVARQADEGHGGQKGAAQDPASDAAFLLMNLAATGEPIAAMLDSSIDKALAGKWKGAHVLAMLAVAAGEAKHPKGPALAARLEQMAIQQGGLAHWEATKDDWHGYGGGEVIPTINALKALSLLKPQSSLIGPAENFLATEYKGYGWYSTWSTAQAVSLLPYIARNRKLNWDGGLDLTANVQGGPSWSFKKVEGPGFRRWNSRDPRPGYLSMPEANAVTLNTSGRGTLVWTYAYQVPGSAAPTPMAATSAAIRLKVNRRLWKLRTPQETGNATAGWVRAPWTGNLKVGDEAWMELNISTDQSADYAVLEVPIPAGLNPTVKLEGLVLEGHAFSDNDSSDRWWAKPRIEVHPDRVVFFFQKLWSWESQRVRILLRAGMAGRYRVRPAKLSLMSDETQWATSDGLDMTVQEGGVK